MPILIRIGVFFIWALAAILIQRLRLFNVFAFTQWHPTVSEINNTTSPLIKASQTCMTLREQLGSQVVQVSGEQDYARAIQNPASFFNSVFRPACVVIPRVDVEVQVTMRAIYSNKVRYAVMSGGHSGMDGWNTVQDGILIFFGSMNNVTYDALRNRATIQPGVRWGDALDYLEPFGVAPMGGRLGNIGTGLLLGGGISYLAPENGWSADGITAMDVILVDGHQVTATATNQYSDLFRALKGGGSRFGIVTRFEVEPVQVGTSQDKNFYGGAIIYPESSAEAIIRWAHKFAGINTDPKAAALVVLGYAMRDGRPVASHTVVCFQRRSAFPTEIFESLLDIPHDFKDIGPRSYMEAANIFGSGEYREGGGRFAGTSFSGEPERSLKAFKDFRRFATETANLVNYTVFAFTPIPLHQIQMAKSRGGNALAPAETPYLSAHWHTVFLAGEEQIPPKVEIGLQWLMKQYPPSPGAPLDMNESDASQNIYATYGDYEFLRRVYQKYDPSRFNARFSQGPIGL